MISSRNKTKELKMKTVLITGANKGIGFETAKQLAELGYFVYLGCRSESNGIAAAKKLNDAGFSNIDYLIIDVTDDKSVELAKEKLEHRIQKLDVLINNAGMSGGMPQTALNATMEQYRSAFDINLFGVVRVTQAFIDLLKKSDEPRIVNVTSGQGSLTLAADPTSIYYKSKLAVYQPSKAALNMYTIALAYELRDTNFKINMVCPGYTKTDFNGNRGTGTIEQAGQRIVKFAILESHGPTGKYICEEIFPETGECPW